MVGRHFLVARGHVLVVAVWVMRWGGCRGTCFFMVAELRVLLMLGKGSKMDSISPSSNDS